ncbi:hypothetical protein JD969_19150 [Planctomycetota bacterium]|nr:hypothetical protein JD969_19150 [Planctomycetota bacterium]
MLEWDVVAGLVECVHVGFCDYNMGMRDQDYILDLSSSRGDEPCEDVNRGQEGLANDGQGKSGGQQGPAGQGRGWIAMKWKCCGAYSRVYKNRVGDAYEGRCPKCMKLVKVKIGPGGTNDRFFEAH